MHRSLAAPGLRAFADGFLGGLTGGLLYCLALAYFHPAELDLAWLRVAAVSVTFGGFEMWRVTRKPTLRSLRASMFWTLALSLFGLWALGAIAPPTGETRTDTPPQFQSKSPRV